MSLSINENDFFQQTDFTTLEKDIRTGTHGRFDVTMKRNEITLQKKATLHAVNEWYDVFFPISALQRKRHFRHDNDIIRDSLYATFRKYDTDQIRIDHDLQQFNEVVAREDKKQIIGHAVIYGMLFIGGFASYGYKYRKTLFKFSTRKRIPYQRLVNVEKETNYLSRVLTKEEALQRQNKRQAEREYQVSLRKEGKEARDLLYVNPQEYVLKKKSSGGSMLQRIRTADRGGGGGAVQHGGAADRGGLELRQPELSAQIVWRRDKSCKLYESETELAKKVRERFGRNATAVKYRDCIKFLEEEGWYVADYDGKHPKLANTEFPEIVDKVNEKEYYAQFYNEHGAQDDRHDLLRWATFIGKKYGPTRR